MQEEEQKQEQIKHKKWYKKWWGILIVLMFLPFVTIWYIWKKTNWNKSVKVILTILVIIIIASAGGEKKDTKPEAQQPTTQEEQLPEGPFSKLSITDVNVSGGEVTISGNTDLPNGATLIVDFDVWGRSGSDLYIGVDKKTAVSNGKFNVILDVPQRDEFKKGPYEVSVFFTPRRQSDSVIALVGKDGENLEGDLVDKTFNSFNTLKLEKKVDIQLSIIIPSYIFQMPSKFPRGSAEKTLAEWALAWKNQDWQKMVNFSQKTWVSGESDPAVTLKAWYDIKTLKGFEITNVQKDSIVTDITFVVYYEEFTNQIDKKQITARVIKETAAYTPSTQGQWGVNPTSVLREKDVN